MRERIKRLKEEKNAVILAHNYQLPEIQDIADFVGDSLELAIRATEVTEPLIVFCGVHFMAETAKILNPEKTVLIPVREAGCPLADQLTPEMIIKAKEAFPDAGVVVYVNSTAECKAEADITCTSANADKAVKSLPNKTIIFGPDANLAHFVQGKVPEKKIIAVPSTGHCHVHTSFTLEDIEEARRRGGRVVCHPECPPSIQEKADLIASTGGMVKIAPQGEVWNIFTEREMAYRLRTLYPEKTFYAKEGAICHDMKLTTLETLEQSLAREQYDIELPAEIMDRARGAIERMIRIRR